MTTTPELDRATAYIASIGVEPLQAGTAATTLRDLSLAVGWHDLRALKLEGTQWSVLVGHKRKQVSRLSWLCSSEVRWASASSVEV